MSRSVGGLKESRKIDGRDEREAAVQINGLICTGNDAATLANSDKKATRLISPFCSIRAVTADQKWLAILLVGLNFYIRRRTEAGAGAGA